MASGAERQHETSKDSLYSLMVNGTVVSDVMGQEMYGRVKEMIADKLGKYPREVTDDAILMDDLEADSLDMVELLMEAEELLKIGDIPDKQSEVINRVRHVRDLVNVRAAAKINPDILPAWLAQRAREIEEYKTERGKR